MKKALSILTLVTLFLSSCTKTSKDKAADPQSSNDLDYNTTQPAKTGVITAAEWNDLDNWPFWTNILEKSDFVKMPSYWEFFNTNRVSVALKNQNNEALSNVVVQLKKGNTTVFTTRTDNWGIAVLWPSLLENNSTDLSQYKIDINNGDTVITSIKSYEQGGNDIYTEIKNAGENEINVSFVIDATGSMGDELKYLKTELTDVLNRVKGENPDSKVATSSIVYRDEGDDYVTKTSEFTDNIQTTMDFLNNQEAGGGGDLPEAVHTALHKAVNDLKWSGPAKTKIIFLLLDAPPHYKSDVITNIQNSVLEAAKKGIKIIPIVASGADKETEFLMRFMAISTNGTYVFITDESGKGDKHMAASVGNYKIEFLNNLMARLINKYAK